MSAYWLSYPDFERDVTSIFDSLLDERSDNTKRPRKNNEASTAMTLAPARFAPAVDVIENDKDFTIKAELPGVPKDKVSIELQSNTLVIQGTTETISEQDKGSYKVSERRRGSFQRSLRVPQGLKSDEITAKFDNGILTITFPKKPVDTQAKTISIS
ncbi:hypothetical protein E5Q_01018 [Mixia osmundae IAM 14324]|uniref:SHSP domain-containing protein n=1 Tax=Mixia osmundae (strain CBS 9802 / IAM 14324 / JCM 22182 / KY 12970) TaxID=764103 RepID=G7DUV7_MIXOS|nr:hypothetical protein E5Q_01018 [Mixia osmundae IAM 14324]